jgi:hypothetical protein
VAALATVVALAAVGVASLRASPRRDRWQQLSAQWVAAMLLWAVTLLLLLLEFVIVDLSGRL